MGLVKVSDPRPFCRFAPLSAGVINALPNSGSRTGADVLLDLTAMQCPFQTCEVQIFEARIILYAEFGEHSAFGLAEINAVSFTTGVLAFLEAYMTMDREQRIRKSSVKKKIARALLMGISPTAIVSFTVLWVNLGFSEKFLRTWLKSWMIGYSVMVPIIFFIAPAIDRFVEFLFNEKSSLE
jgi:hypothetical protein